MKLDDILDEFSGLDPRECLETLVEMSHELPDLSPQRAEQREDSRYLVRECQTPVYLWVDCVNGVVQLEAYVTERSPTVRGYVSMLVEGISGSAPQEVAAISENLLDRLGLEEALGMNRRRGFSALIQRIKREVAEQDSAETRRD